MGARVTPPRTGMFMHIGGPCDGTKMPVTLDENNEPVELHIVHDFTAPREAIPAFAGHQSQLLNSSYQREEQLGDDGFEYVYRYLGTDTINQNTFGKRVA